MGRFQSDSPFGKALRYSIITPGLVCTIILFLFTAINICRFASQIPNTIKFYALAAMFFYLLEVSFLYTGFARQYDPDFDTWYMDVMNVSWAIGNILRHTLFLERIRLTLERTKNRVSNKVFIIFWT